jgi:hypothetical protein
LPGTEEPHVTRLLVWSITRSETPNAGAFCFSASVSRAKADRSFSVSGAQGQPNHAFSQMRAGCRLIVVV